MSSEQPLKPKTFAEIEVEMKERGYTLAGKEPLAVFGFDAESKQFRTTSYRTHEEIIDQYREKFKHDKGIAIELVNAPKQPVNPDGMHEDEESVYVFIRKDEGTSV